MTGFSGFVNAAFQIGIQSFLIKPKRGITNITLDDGSTLPDIAAQAVVEEQHDDDLEITDHPVEQGAAITDHAFKRPAKVTLTLGWSNSPSLAAQIISAGTAAQSSLNGSQIEQIKTVYQNLLKLQSSRAMFTLYTGKRVYSNMVCKTLSTSTTSKTENSFVVTLVCQQIIVVNTQTVTLAKSVQKNPSQTASPVNKGRQTPAISSKTITIGAP